MRVTTDRQWYSTASLHSLNTVQYGLFVYLARQAANKPCSFTKSLYLKVFIDGVCGSMPSR